MPRRRGSIAGRRRALALEAFADEATSLGLEILANPATGAQELAAAQAALGLAILGILIGVTAVIWLVAMGEGVSYQAQQQIKDLGANNIIVRSTKPPADAIARRRVRHRLRPAARRFRPHRGERAHADPGRADARDSQGGALSRQA